MMKFTEKIFSIKNENCHKIITILGIKFKVFSNKLANRSLIKKLNKCEIEVKQLKQEIDGLKKANSRSDYIHNKRFEQWLLTYRWLEFHSKLINKLIDYNNDEELKKSQIKYLFKNIHKGEYLLDIDNPKTFNEKLQWLSLNYFDKNDEIHRIVDKVQFKDYIKEKLGDGYTIPLLGKWDQPSDIDWESLPEKFVLKSNWGGDDNQVKIIRNKTKINISSLEKELEQWLTFDGNAYYYAFNGTFKDIKPCIFAEEFIDTNNNWMLDDYKFFCFNGKFKLGYVDVRIEGETGKIYHFDKDWNLLPIIKPGHEGDIRHFPQKPAQLDEIIKIAEFLAKDFPFARVDFFITPNKLYVGEITFTPSGGLGIFNPIDWDYKLGEMLDISELIGGKNE